ncbi:MAG: GNAT family N-acetyltransferase [Thermoprotei archaeon]|nr:GNAT family N-acetyltransferase [Thermoprotei archaeon]
MEYEGPRGARVGELDEVLDLVNLVFRTSRGLPPTMGEEFTLLFNEGNVENLRIIKHGDRVVSHVGIFECEALIYGCRLKIGMIGSVCTHPDYRMRGLATKLMEDALKKMTRDGVNIVMVSGIRSLYDRAGCAIAGLSYDVTLKRDELRGVHVDEGKVKLVMDKGMRVLDFVRVYQREGVRYIRPFAHFKALLRGSAWRSRGRANVRLSFLIYDEGEVVGYVVVHKVQEGTEAQVVEYAGERRSVLYALKSITEAHGLSAIDLKIPAWDVEMLRAFRRCGLLIPTRTTRIAGTVRLLNIDETMRKLKPYLSERIEEDVWMERDGEYVLRIGDESLKVGGEKELAWLFFGVPEKVHEAFRKFMPKGPIVPPSEGISRACERIFPIPLLPYGLYYT